MCSGRGGWEEWLLVMVVLVVGRGRGLVEVVLVVASVYVWF